MLNMTTTMRLLSLTQPGLGHIFSHQFNSLTVLSSKVINGRRCNSGISLFGNLRSYSTSSESKLESAKLKSSVSEVEELDAPIQFTTSKASKWTAAETHMMVNKRNFWKHQPLIVVFSVGCLLIWFGILREENDMDEEIEKPLWQRIPGLERTQILTVIRYNRENGLPTTDLEVRLLELDELEAKGQGVKWKK